MKKNKDYNLSIISYIKKKRNDNNIKKQSCYSRALSKYNIIF